MSLLDTIKNIGKLGGFGDLIFTVNPLKQLTFEDAEHSSSVNYAKHDIIGDLPKLEFIAPNLDDIKINMKLSSYFGLDPTQIAGIVNEYMQNGDIYDLFIGTENLGEYVITAINKTYKKIDFFGNVVEMTMSVSFLEYN